MDSEKLLYALKDDYDLTNSAEEADILIINSCAFLNASRKEAIDNVFDFVHLKEDGRLKKIILAGCLPQ